MEEAAWLLRWFGEEQGLLRGAYVVETRVRVGDRVTLEGEVVGTVERDGYRDQPVRRLAGRPGRPIVIRHAPPAADA